jgi:predicted TIM-barrel fold metal-dependent hydrolase
MWELFGPARLLYASNWPVSERFAPLGVIQSIVADYVRGRGQVAEEQVFWKSAQAAYRWTWREQSSARHETASETNAPPANGNR